MRTKPLGNRKLTSFRLHEGLLTRLRIQAKEENRSLNNYVESALMRIVYRKPNATTLAAMKEAQEDINMTDIDMTDMQTFMKSLELE